MQEARKKSAILFFTRSAEVESRYKKIARRNRDVIQELIHSTEDSIRNSKLPVIRSSEEFQIGDSFGEKLVNEIQRVFSHGYENVIVIGNDSPDLTSDHLIEANQLLESNDLILGPSEDGGAFLIALNKSIFNKGVFQKLSWETDKAYQDLLTYAFTMGSDFIELERIRDIDNEEDLSQWLRRTGLNYLALKITSILATEIPGEPQDVLEIKSSSSLYNSLRAPPTFSN